MKIVFEYKEEKLNEIEKQLHEQYAINNNSNLGHIVALMVGLFAVIGFYGMVYIESSYYFEDIEKYKYSLTDLCISTCCSYIVLGIMAYLCIYQGIQQRNEQFIIWAIRKKQYENSYNNPKLFPNSYHPFNKKGIEIVQGLYGEFIKIISAITLVISISLIIKLLVNCYYLHQNNISEFAIIILIVLIVHLVTFYSCWKRFYKSKNKYQAYIESYKKIAPISIEEPIEIEEPNGQQEKCNLKLFIKTFIFTGLCSSNNQKTHSSVQQNATDI